MDPSEFQQWVMEGPGLPPTPTAGTTYHVPNVVYVVIGNITIGIYPFYVFASLDEETYLAKGFAVKRLNRATKLEMATAFASTWAYGFDFWGHGDEGNLVAADFPGVKSNTVPYYLSSGDVDVAHKLAILNLHACYAGTGGWATFVAPGGNYYAPMEAISGYGC
jgi:hypothetical protein